MPTKTALLNKELIKETIFNGLLPANPFISRDDLVICFGSCFANNIRKYLIDHGYNVSRSKENIDSFGAGMVTSFTILQQFQWAFENRTFPDDVWYISPNEKGLSNESSRKNTRDILRSCKVFIITLGLSEVWFHKQTGDVFWKAIPRDHFNKEIHGFRMTTVKENKNNILSIINLVRRYIGDIPIIFTLSPIKLRATFRPISCPVANVVSKAVLRSSLDEVLNEANDFNCYYWPSYELIHEVYPMSFQDDNCHVYRAPLLEIMDLFNKYYLI